MRERRDAKKKQQQEAVENKLRRVQLRESSHALKSELVKKGMAKKYVKILNYSFKFSFESFSFQYFSRLSPFLTFQQSRKFSTPFSQRAFPK